MNKFYFDAYNEVQADSFEGMATFIDGTTQTKVMFFNDTCKLPFDISLRKHYKIQIGGVEYPISYRFIVQTRQFEEENTYNGPLGTIYHEEHTDFYLWAPTAYAVILQLAAKTRVPMQYIEQGVYHVRMEGDFEGVGYKYFVQHEEVVETLDPYAISSTINSEFNYVINPEKIIPSIAGKSIANKRDSIVYEVNVRDFTSDRSIPFQNPGKYLGMIEKGITDAYGNKVGMDYVLDLGVTHIQLMPVYDYGSIDENEGSVPYNWGYDPVQFNVPEGKYSSDPAHPYRRIDEVVAVVNAYHQHEIGVIMDVVYNHVYDERTFSFSKIVPYYFFRYERGVLSDASFCGNETASERSMVRRFIVDSIGYLTSAFGFDGYRFDLMGILDIETMNLIYEKALEINPNIYIFGEGWTMPTAIPTQQCAVQTNYDKVSNIGFFNDKFRNVAKQIMIGHINGYKEEMIRPLLLGTDYNNPTNSLQYISCHDDYTIFDQLYYDYQVTEHVIDKIKRGYALVFLSQGNPFLHMGCEAGRTKQGIKNSFNHSEVINQVDWSLFERNKELVQYVKELIRLRKSSEFHLLNSDDEIREQITINVVNDCVYYYVGNIMISINYSEQPISIDMKGQLLSQDGQRYDSRIDEARMISHYAVVKI